MMCKIFRLKSMEPRSSNSSLHPNIYVKSTSFES
uniref:Uncharacterized protein n=1 Tax=Arundo donax TaxID=35708 RepID=A0A0A9BQ24_ARUDO